MPDLVTGAAQLNAWPFSGRPARIDWRETHYESMAPATFVMRDAVVHASAGIIAIDDDVITETLWHTDPDAHGYEFIGDQVRLRPRAVRHLPGTHITVLAGAKGNYYHAMLEGAARLAMLPPHLLDTAESVLVPHGAIAQDFVLNHLSLPPHLRPLRITDAEALRIDTLIYPWSLHGDCDYHPCVIDFYDRIAARLGAPARDLPRRFHIDRRGTDVRPLLNEADVIERLRADGFVPLRLEDLGFADQVRLFRGAEAIVAPHGAGLTNLGYCRPGTVVLEIFPDAYVNWCFRRLAAVRRLRYDCVLGRAVDPWTTDMVNPHALRWQVSADHVLAAIGHLLAAGAAARPG